MDHVHRVSRPQLRRPHAILAWEGWNDACDAASGAVAYLLGQRDDPEPFAWIEPEEFYDFQVRRPHVEVDDGGTRSLSWPLTSAFSIKTDATHDLVLALGEEPSLRWKTYTRSVARLLAESDVEMVVTLGAFIGQVAHTVPVPIIGVATDPKLVERYGLQTSRYQGPTGVVGVMLEACREIGMPAISLWAATPHYLASNPNPKAMPISPIFLERSSGGVMSAMYACATVMLAPQMPARTREKVRMARAMAGSFIPEPTAKMR